ncbi:hypothetical protein MNBD_ALPHA05-646, partial [hydrothermal vent metagenome]
MRVLFVIFAFWAASIAPSIAQNPDFTTWLEGFRAEATAAGVSAEVFDAAFEGV